MGDLIQILNLKPTNGLVDSPGFKTQTLQSVLKGFTPEDYLGSLNLKDAYFHIPVHPVSRKFMRFCIQMKYYQYTVLPFHLTTSPRIFTKVISPLMGALHMRASRCFLTWTTFC